MLKSQTIPIEQVVNSRQLHPNDDLTELTESLKTGQKQPLLLDGSMNLIDGARRLTAMANLGMTKVSVVISTQFDDTVPVLAKVRKHGLLARPITPQRLWQMYNAVQAQMVERGLLSRKRRTGLPRDAYLEPVPRSRLMFSAALGFEGEAQLAAANLLYKNFETEKDPVRLVGLMEIKRALEADEITLYQARGRLDRLGKGDMNGDIVNINDQRDALATTLNQLTGVMKSTTRIGELNQGLTPAELQLYLKGFEQVRRDLQRFITSFRKRVKE